MCETEDIPGLLFCDKRRYSCAIVRGPDNPREDAFIEWFWVIKYDAIYGENYITGKFTFSASASYINSIWKKNGNNYINPSTNYGIPMFNTSNHNV